MADYTHIENLIMGEVIRIKERRPPENWQDDLETLVTFLGQMRQQVLMEKIRAAEELPEPDDPTANESAVEEDQL